MVHILTFNEIYKERIWGGQNLRRIFDKSLPSKVNIGESWELADLPEDKSVVSAGPAAGTNLAELVARWKTDLLGGAKLDGGQFPLLIKFLDANDILSVQVHPDYESADRLGGGPIRAKYECWYILDASASSCVYIGFKPGTTAAKARKAIENGTLAELLVKIPAHRGDFFYVPGGTVHALGSGLVVAEIQTPSDTTFRLFDWNRIDAKTGRPRTLHIDQGLQAICYDASVQRPDPGSDVLCCAPTFSVRKVEYPAGEKIAVHTGEPIVWVVISGSGVVRDAAVQVDIQPGKVILFPAGLSKVDADFTSQSTCLEVKLTR